MKIYNKPYFVSGLIFLCVLPLFALGVIEADWWQWAAAIAFSARFLSIGLSKTESDRQNRIKKEYRSVAQKLYGRYALLKINLPWFLLGGFFAAGFLLRFALDIILPAWAAVCFVLVLTVSVFYSIGLHRRIIECIEQEAPVNSPNSR